MCFRIGPGRWRALELTLLVLGAASCQRQPVYPTRDGSVLSSGPVDAGFGSVMALIRANDCPEVVITVAPAGAHVGESLEVVARASDLNANDTLSFTWFSRAGSLSDPTLAATTYTCPGRDQAGPQSIGLTVSDGKCQTTRTVTVSCLALADGGGPTGAGGARGDAGGVCVGDDSTTCEGDACNQCTVENCDTLAGVNLRGGTAIAGCDIFVSALQRQLCDKAYACMRDRGCVQNADPRRCWCGDVDLTLCETGAVPGNGACRQELFDAAGTTDPVLVDLRLADPTFPIGGAFNLATCRSVYCSVLSSDSTSTACRL